MEIVNQRRKMLDAMESNLKGNGNFATKVIRTENAEKKCKRSNKEESNLFLFQTIRFSKFCPRMYKEWYIWTNDHHHEQFTGLFYILFRMYNMDKTSDAHLNAKLCT